MMRRNGRVRDEQRERERQRDLHVFAERPDPHVPPPIESGQSGANLSGDRGYKPFDASDDAANCSSGDSLTMDDRAYG